MHLIEYRSPFCDKASTFFVPGAAGISVGRPGVRLKKFDGKFLGHLADRDGYLALLHFDVEGCPQSNELQVTILTQ